MIKTYGHQSKGDQAKERADKKGCFCCVAYGWEAAMQAVGDWIKENPS